MLEPPIATSSPVPRTKQWGRRKSNNNRRSISLLDVSAIQTPDVSSQKSESNETLTSVCKDSGYVHSEGSWLEDEESRESKDLVEELKFKDVLISELQASNRGLRVRCADAENKIWRLRIKCEEHCGCCQVQGSDKQDGEDELFSDSNDKLFFPHSSLPMNKRHSLAVSKFNTGDEGYSVFRGSVTSNTVSAHRLGGSMQNKPIVRSRSSGMIPMQKSRDKTHKGFTNDHQLTPESLSLSKVQWWQRDLFTQGRESTKDSLQSDQTAQHQFNKSQKKLSGEPNSYNQPDEFSASVANDARMISRLVCQQSEEECAEKDGCEMEQSEKLAQYSPCSSDEDLNRTSNLKDTALRSHRVLSQVQTIHSSSESDSSFPPLLSVLPTENHVRVQNGGIQMHRNEIGHELHPNSFTGPTRDYRSLTQNNLATSGYSEDATTQKPSCELGCCLDSPKSGNNINKCSSSSLNTLNGNNVFHSQSHCDCMRPPSQIIIVPGGCCCRLIDSSSLCRQSCCLYDGNTKCDQQCHISSKHPPNGCLDAPSAEHLPLFVPKSKSASVQSKESSPVPVNSHCDLPPISEHIPTQMVNPCTYNNCSCATPCSRGLTVPLAQRLDIKAKMIREIEERMNKLAKNARAETDSLSFKPWPPPHFAEMSPLMRCLAETSDYARQMAMVFGKATDRIQRISAMSQLTPSV